MYIFIRIEIFWRFKQQKTFNVMPLINNVIFTVDRLIRQWAPIVWLAPEEKFMPLGVDEFLNNVHPRDKGKTFIPRMPIGDDSKKAYLVTNEEIGK